MISETGINDSLLDALTQVIDPINTRPPNPPCSPNFTFGPHALFVEACSPQQVFNCLVTFLTSNVAASGVKVSRTKYSVKAEVIVESVSCTIKARIYSQHGKYAVDIRRRAGDFFAFQNTSHLLRTFLEVHCSGISANNDGMPNSLDKHGFPKAANGVAVCPATPTLRPVSDPYFSVDMEEIVLPECAHATARWTPSEMKPATSMNLLDLEDLELSDVKDTDIDTDMDYLAKFQRQTPDQGPSRTLVQTVEIGKSISSEMIFTLDGLSDTSSNVDADELSLRTLFAFDDYDEHDRLESSDDFSTVGVCCQTEATKAWCKPSEISAPGKVSGLHLRSPILMALLQASSSCSTREPTPSPKGILGTKQRSEMHSSAQVNGTLLVL
jgi:hypothetical protein